MDLGFHIGPTHRYVLLEREVGSTRRQEIGSVPTDRLAYVHSFGLTDRYAAIVESPLELRVRRLFQDRPFIKRFAWDESWDTRFLVVDLSMEAVIESIHEARSTAEDRSITPRPNRRLA